MSNYSKYIPEDLAKELLSFGMPLFKYKGLYDGKPYIYTEDKDSTDCNNRYMYRIPTYGEVIDWFSSKGVHITFDAFFTFALADNVGYLWKVSYIDKSNGDIKLVTISEEDDWNGKKGYGGSFELDAQSAIRYAINLKKNI